MHSREFWLFPAFVFDLRHSFRGLVRTPAHSLTVLLVLTVGIAANATIFSVLQEVILRPLPYRNPDDLVMAWERNPALGEPSGSRVYPSWKVLEQWRQRNHSFAGLEAFDRLGYNLTGHDRPVRVDGARATPSFFSLLGVSVQFGRLFLPTDASGNRVVILTDKFFRNHFSNIKDALGQTILLDNEPYVIIGVLPAKFHLPSMWQGITEFKPDIWVPLPEPLTPAEQEARRLLVFGRLRHGISLAKAKDDLSGIVQQMANEDPKRGAQWSANVFPLPVEDVYPSVRTALFVLSASALFILLIACANLANLMLARNLERKKEIAIHLALGGTRKRLAGRALIESLLLALPATVFALLLTYLGVKTIIALNPGLIHTPERIHLDIGSGLFALALGFLTSILFGPVPVYLSTRENFADTLKQNSRSTQSHIRSYFRRSLLAGQIAVSVFLAIVAVLTIRSFQRVLAVDPGYNPDRILTAHVVLPDFKYAKPEERLEFCSRLVKDTQSLPGVDSVSLIDNMPLYDIKQTYFVIEGHSIPARQTPPVSDYANVAPQFFETLEIHVRQGRLFATEDFRDNANVAIINETLARRYWLNQSPIGDHIHMRTPDSAPLAIIGVVNDFVEYSMDSPPRPEMFLPAREMQEMTIVVKAKTAPLGLAQALQSTVWKIDKDQAVSKIEALDWKLNDNISQTRFNTILLSMFAAIALGVALIGTFGLISFVISAKKHDFALRRALGASRRHILVLLLWDIVQPLAIGIFMGVLLSRMAGSVLSDLYFHVTMTDPITLVGLPILVFVSSLLVLAQPAWKASGIEPSMCLRYE